MCVCYIIYEYSQNTFLVKEKISYQNKTSFFLLKIILKHIKNLIKYILHKQDIYRKLLKMPSLSGFVWGVKEAVIKLKAEDLIAFLECQRK